MNARQKQYSLYSTFYVFVIIAVLGVANYLANKNNKTFDTTSNKRYSLSDQTTKIVKGLSKDVQITYWDNQEGFTAAKDVLNQYTILSSKLKVEYVDAIKKPALARAAGISNLGTIIVESAGQIQALNNIDYLPRPEEIYEALSELVFGETGTGLTMLAVAAVAFAWIARSFRGEGSEADAGHTDAAGRPVEAYAGD